jgi:hypothetical protein
MTLRSYTVTDLAGNVLEVEGVRIKRDDGMTIEVYPRKTDGFVDVSAYSGVLLVHPRGANSIYVTAES